MAVITSFRIIMQKIKNTEIFFCISSINLVSLATTCQESVCCGLPTVRVNPQGPVRRPLFLRPQPVLHSKASSITRNSAQDLSSPGILWLLNSLPENPCMNLAAMTGILPFV